MKPYALLLSIASSLCFATGVQSITIAGIEFTDAVFIEIPAASNVFLETTEDLYIRSPIFVDSALLDAQFEVVLLDGLESIVINPISPCSSSCLLEPGLPLQETDIVLNLLGPVGDLAVHANNIVVGSMPIPEPSTGILFVFGVTLIAAKCRSGGGRRPTSRCSWHPTAHSNRSW
jgi:hypothetical protein